MNRLAQCHSLYLRQHQNNPVDWYPWGEEALSRARQEKKPVFLSIGYSSCHWCHVMEKESFSQPEIAEILNREFVPIKVDREERPDIDEIYMKSVQLMTGQGGWPLNVFLTPELRPFFGGTYFPPQPRHGIPAFGDLLKQIASAFENQPDAVKKNADWLMNALFQTGRYFESKSTESLTLVDQVISNLEKLYEPEFGGFGSAPKFFHVDGLRLFLRRAFQAQDPSYLKKVEHTIEAMLCGGIYDQVGGGFHRYSVDKKWQVPHFEKMLYDNALLPQLLVELWQYTHQSLYREKCLEILDWAHREMLHPEGGFYSSIDADSEGGEGRFYLWDQQELEELIPQDQQQAFMARFSVHPDGNFEGYNILCLSEGVLSQEEREYWAPTLKSLLQHRSQRSWPAIDSKRQTSWNALMLSALSKAYAAFRRPKDYEAAVRLVECFWQGARKEGRLKHVLYDDAVSSEGFLEDYAYFADGLLDLFEATVEPAYLEKAQQLAAEMKEAFYDQKGGGFWSTREAQEDRLVRTKEIWDSSVPSAYAVAIGVYQRLYALLAKTEYAEIAEHSASAVLGTAEEQPGGFQRLALVLDEFQFGSPLLIAVSPKPADQESLRATYHPVVRKLIVEQWNERHNQLSLLHAKQSDEPRYYWCQSGECQAPQDDWRHLLASNLAGTIS